MISLMQGGGRGLGHQCEGVAGVGSPMQICKGVAGVGSPM